MNQQEESIEGPFVFVFNDDDGSHVLFSRVGQ